MDHSEFGEIRKGDIPHSLASIERAVKDLNYIPEVKIDEGINKTVKWFYSNV